MKQIKFSHKNYEKFRRLGKDGIFPPFRARLLQVFIINSTRISSSFQDYDTKYYDDEEGHYPLNSQKRLWLVLLLEEETTKGLFTTIRSHNPSKEQYYRNSQGETFMIVYTGEKND